MAYSNKRQVELMYGCVNIEKWADLDQKKNTVYIEARVDYQIAFAEDYINSTLRNGKYTTPFTAVPKFIEYLTTLYAGVLLYEGRQVVEKITGASQVSRQKKMFFKYMDQILQGRLTLVHPTSGEALPLLSSTVPSVYDHTATLCGCGCGCLCGCYKNPDCLAAALEVRCLTPVL